MKQLHQLIYDQRLPITDHQNQQLQTAHNNKKKAKQSQLLYRKQI